MTAKYLIHIQQYNLKIDLVYPRLHRRKINGDRRKPIHTTNWHLYSLQYTHQKGPVKLKLRVYTGDQELNRK